MADALPTGAALCLPAGLAPQSTRITPTGSPVVPCRSRPRVRAAGTALPRGRRR